MPSKFAELGFEDVGDGHSERFVNGPRRHLQACNQFHEGLLIHHTLSLELPYIFRSDIDSVDSTDGYELNSIFIEPYSLQVILQLALDGGEAFRVPVYSVHFVHRHNEFMNSQ